HTHTCLEINMCMFVWCVCVCGVCVEWLSRCGVASDEVWSGSTGVCGVCGVWCGSAGVCVWSGSAGVCGVCVYVCVMLLHTSAHARFSSCLVSLLEPLHNGKNTQKAIPLTS